MAGVLADELNSATTAVAAVLFELATPWTAYQAVLAAICFVAARLAAAAVAPALEARIRQIKDQPRLMRALVVPLRRLSWILFAVLLWLATGVLREVTWPSNSHLLSIAASLVTAWAAISVLSRVLRKRSLSRVVAIAGWLFAALYIVDWLDDVLVLLDRIALTVGDFRMSLLVLLKGLVILGVVLWGGSLLGDFLERQTRASDLMTPRVHALVFKVLKSIVLVAAVLISLSTAGLDLTVLTIFSGAFGLGLGFGLQKVAANLMSGFIILLDRSVKPGDVIQLGETFGWIASLRARYVSVVTRDGVEYLVPNEAFITENVVNWSYTNRQIRLEIKFGVSYDSDPHAVRKLTAEAVTKIDRVLKYPAPVCHLVAFGDSSLDFVLRFWIDDPEQGLTNIRGAALLAVWDTLRASGVSIPYPHREVILKRPIPSD